MRDQSWSTSLSTATSTRTDPWTVQGRQQAAAKATRTASVFTAISTHDAALASYLADWTNSSIDAKTLAINARATAIATSSGAKNLANYNFGTNAPVSIGGIAGSGTVTGSGQSPFAFVGYGGDEKSPSNGPQPSSGDGPPLPSRPSTAAMKSVYEQQMRNSQGGEIIRGTRVTANQIEGYGSIRNSARTAKSVEHLKDFQDHLATSTPILGIGVEGYKAYSGQDLSGRELSGTERFVSGFTSVLSVFGVGMADEIVDGTKSGNKVANATRKLDDLAPSSVARGGSGSNRWWFEMPDGVPPSGPSRFGDGFRNIWRDNPQMPAFSMMTGRHAGEIGVRPDMSSRARQFWYDHESGHAALTNALRFNWLQQARQGWYNLNGVFTGAEEAIVHGRAVYLSTESLRMAFSEGLRYPFEAITGSGQRYVTLRGVGTEIIIGAGIAGWINFFWQE